MKCSSKSSMPVAITPMLPPSSAALSQSMKFCMDILPMCSEKSGTERASSPAKVTVAKTHGRASTALLMAPQTPPPREGRPRPGIRSQLTR